MSDLEWAVIGFDRQEQCEFIDTTPDDREQAYFTLRRHYSKSRFAGFHADARVVCRTVSEWRAPTDEDQAND